MLNVLKNHRRRLLLAEPFPEAWRPHLQRHVPYFAWLSVDRQTRLRDNLRIVIAEKEWVGCGGLSVTDEMRVTIAAQACLLVLEFQPPYHYDRVKSVLIYPRPYRHRPDRWGRDGSGLSGQILLGEAWHRSPIVLAWESVVEGAANPHDGHNVVFHEFAHHLDGVDGQTDGTPPLESREQYRQWELAVLPEYQRLVRARNERQPSLLDYYGATNQTEFFAVATECFFEQGLAMRERHPQLYEALRGFYRQDTAAWPQGEQTDEAAADAGPARNGERGLCHDRHTETGGAASAEENAADEAAIAAWLKQIRLKPGSADAHFSLGLVYLQSRQYELAIESLSAALRVSPRDGEVLRHRGIAYLRLSKFDAARADLDAAIELDAEDVEAFRARAEARLRASDFAGALEDCRAALRADHRDATALHLQGLAFAATQDYSQALQSLDRAIRSDPNRADFYADRSRILKTLGELDRADDDRVEAIRRDPGLAESLR